MRIRTRPGLTHTRPLRRARLLTPTTGNRWATILLALLVLLIPTASWAWANHDTGPTTLTQAVLTGQRGPACQRIVLAADVSGSMIDYTTARDNALSAYLAWAPTNLRSDDQLAVLEFSGTAGWTRTPSPITDPTNPGPHPTLTGGTALTPVLELIAALPPSTCDTALLLISDAQIPDLPTDPATGRDSLTTAHVHDIGLLVPSPAINIPSSWTVAYPAATPIIFDGLNPDTTGIALATATAHLTGQTLTTR